MEDHAFAPTHPDFLSARQSGNTGKIHARIDPIKTAGRVKFDWVQQPRFARELGLEEGPVGRR